jgi:deoxyribose-phosphate aldolase
MELSGYLEHTRLKPDTSREEILKICRQAIEFNMLGVCVPPFHVSAARKVFDDAKATVKVITVVGFPFGYSRTSAKVEEAKQAARDGADEIDAVINISALKSGDLSAVENDINSIVTACHLQNKKVKLILETGLLKEAEMLALCEMAAKNGADFVKSSTGMLPGGITPDTIAFLRSNLPEKVLVKASGGIRTREQAISLIEAGAARIGTSNGLKILEVK